VSAADDPRRPSWFQTEGWDPAALGRAIVQRREELGLSRKEVAAGSGLSYPYLSELENGTKQGSPSALTAVAKALGLAHHELLARAEAGGPPAMRRRSRRLEERHPDDTLARLSSLRARIREVLAGATPEEAEAALLMSLGEQRVRAATEEPPHDR